MVVAGGVGGVGGGLVEVNEQVRTTESRLSYDYICKYARAAPNIWRSCFNESVS